MKYEYHIVNVETPGSWGWSDVNEEKILEIMHELANEGWEFVSAASIARVGFFRQPGTTSSIALFFKRPKV